MPRKKEIIPIKEPERGLVPAAEEGVKDRVYGAYLSTLDPRANEKIQLALGRSNDPRFKEFLERICVPRYARVSLQSIAKGCNITLADFQNWWNKEATQTAIASAQLHSATITEHMAADAQSTEDMCARCDGLKFVAAPHNLPVQDIPGYRKVANAVVDAKGKEVQPEMWIRDCPKCFGTGYLRKPGDQHSRDKILEMSGLVRKGAGVQIVQNFGGASHSSALSELNDVVTIDI